ncbi:MAG: amidohydrolase [Alphaproteobacteria bacterium]|nr:MAG: amidohydrolase [Alphaproteobacteria bacterium]
MRILNTLAGVSLAALMAGSAFAEDVAITGGTAFTHGGTGKVDNATVLISAGKVTSVTSGGDVPAGYRVVDARDKWVTTGFMVSGTTLGMMEVPSWAGMNDASAPKADHTIGMDATEAINPDTTLIPITRIEGVTRAVIGFTGSKDMWLGQGAVINLGNGEDLVTRSRAFVTLNITENGAEDAGGSRAALWDVINAKLEAADPRGKKDDKKDKDDDKKKDKGDLNTEALARLFDHKESLLVIANRKSDILKAISLKERFGLDVILYDADEAWRVADRLAAAKIPVILDPIDNLPESFEDLSATGAAAARLHAAGVKIAFVGPDTQNARLVVQSAGNAVAMGLPWEAAVDAITVNPAEIFGVSASYGTLEAGKDADVVVWNGDPLEVMTSPDVIFIKGEEIPLVSRQTKLRDRYKEITRSPAYVK